MYILNFPNKKIYHLHIYAFTSTSILSASKNMLLKINTSSNRRLKVLRIINKNLSVHTVVKSVICLRSPIMAALRYRNTNITIESIAFLWSSIEKGKEMKNINITCESFFPVYSKSRQVAFVLRNNGATVFLKDRL